jgi:hypothetical protein
MIQLLKTPEVYLLDMLEEAIHAVFGNGKAVPLNDLTEEQAEKLIPDNAVYIDILEGGKGAKGFLSVLVSEALKSKGLPELQIGDRPSIIDQDVMYGDISLAKKLTAYDRLTPHNQIIVKI